jgi:hypothetical protein
MPQEARLTDVPKLGGGGIVARSVITPNDLRESESSNSIVR